MQMLSEKSVKDYQCSLEAASRTDKIVPNDNIMNTYCVLLWMLSHCRDIIIYCGEARLFSVKGEDKLKKILEAEAVESLYNEVIKALKEFVEKKDNKLRIICERQPSDWNESMLNSLQKPNVTISILKSNKGPYFPYHFMVGDNTVYRRETDHGEKKGVVRFFEDSCKVFRDAFRSYNNDSFIRRLKIV